MGGAGLRAPVRHWATLPSDLGSWAFSGRPHPPSLPRSPARMLYGVIAVATRADQRRNIKEKCAGETMLFEYFISAAESKRRKAEGGGAICWPTRRLQKQRWAALMYDITSGASLKPCVYFWRGFFFNIWNMQSSRPGCVQGPMATLLGQTYRIYITAVSNRYHCVTLHPQTAYDVQWTNITSNHIHVGAASALYIR